MYVCRGEMRFAEFVIVVVDVQHRTASEPHRGCSAIVGRHPEIAGLLAICSIERLLLALQ